MTKWKFFFNKTNQFPYNTLGITWFIFRYEVTRLQKQQGVTKNKPNAIFVKIHVLTKIYIFEWRKINE